MTASIRLHVPVATARAATADTVKTVGSLAGKVVGFIDNAKPNLDLLAADIGALLMARYGVKAVLTRRKPAASVPATDAVLDELAAQCDLVIAGSGD